MSGIKHIITDVVSYAKKTKKESNKPMFAIIIDIIWCGLYYGASPANYYKFDFYRSNHAIRRTFVTNRISRRMISKFNIHEYIDIYEDKVLFDKEFSKYIGRDWISSCNCTEAEYNEFVANNPKFICKPLDGSQGQGITVYDGNAPKFGGGTKSFKASMCLKDLSNSMKNLKHFMTRQSVAYV